MDVVWTSCAYWVTVSYSITVVIAVDTDRKWRSKLSDVGGTTMVRSEVTEKILLLN